MADEQREGASDSELGNKMVDGWMSLKSISSFWTWWSVASSRVTSLTTRDYGAYFRKRQFPMSLEY